MARVVGFLIAFVILVFGAWPYYAVFRLDTALGQADAQALAPFVDLPAIRASYKNRFGDKLDEMVPQGEPEAEPLRSWLTDGLTRLGGQALEQVVTLDFVRSMLRNAVEEATDKRPAYLMAAVNYAFFTSWNQFEVRLGDKTKIHMTLEGIDWRITDIEQ